MPDYIEVSVSPFYNGRGWTDQATGISFEPTKQIRVRRIDKDVHEDLSGIANSVRMNNLLLLEGELNGFGEEPTHYNPEELTKEQFRQILNANGGADVPDLSDDLAQAQSRVQELEAQVSELQAQLDEATAPEEDEETAEEPEAMTMAAASTSTSTQFTQEELEAYTIAELRELAEQENIEITATRKQEIIDEILAAQA